MGPEIPGIPRLGLKTKDAAKALGVTERTIRKWINSGRLQGYQVDPGRKGSAWRVPQSEVARVLKEREEQLKK